jgi:hypothetical protein
MQQYNMLELLLVLPLTLLLALLLAFPSWVMRESSYMWVQSPS